MTKKHREDKKDKMTKTSLLDSVSILTIVYLLTHTYTKKDFKKDYCKNMFFKLKKPYLSTVNYKLSEAKIG
jgi:hypothetical protein